MPVKHFVHMFSTRYYQRGIAKGNKNVVQKKFLICPGINIYLDFHIQAVNIIKDYQFSNCDTNSYVRIVYHSEVYGEAVLYFE